MKKILFSLSLATALFSGSLSQAQTAFTGLYDTGVDASGVSLPDGTIGDPHYTLVTVPAGSTTDIRVRTSAGGFPIPPYIGDSSTSAWIGPNNDGAVDGPTGAYDYRTTFTSPTAGLATIKGLWATDNEGLNILINGVPTGNTNSVQFTSYTSFTAAGSVTAGINTLDFIVNNDGGPTALRVDSISGSVVPEPASIISVSLATGLLLLTGAARRKARAKLV